jgi:hypothetical protein
MKPYDVEQGFRATSSFLQETAGRSLQAMAPRCAGPVRFSAVPILYNETILSDIDYLTIAERYGVDFTIMPPLFT